MWRLHRLKRKLDCNYYIFRSPLNTRFLTNHAITPQTTPVPFQVTLILPTSSTSANLQLSQSSETACEKQITEHVAQHLHLEAPKFFLVPVGADQKSSGAPVRSPFMALKEGNYIVDLEEIFLTRELMNIAGPRDDVPILLVSDAKEKTSKVKTETVDMPDIQVLMSSRASRVGAHDRLSVMFIVTVNMMSGTRVTLKNIEMLARAYNSDGRALALSNFKPQPLPSMRKITNLRQTTLTGSIGITGPPTFGSAGVGFSFGKVRGTEEDANTWISSLAHRKDTPLGAAVGGKPGSTEGYGVRFEESSSAVPAGAAYPAESTGGFSTRIEFDINGFQGEGDVTLEYVFRVTVAVHHHDREEGLPFLKPTSLHRDPKIHFRYYPLQTVTLGLRSTSPPPSAGVDQHNDLKSPVRDPNSAAKPHGLANYKPEGLQHWFGPA